MKKIKSILLITILFFVLLLTTNSFAAEEFSLEKDYLTLLPGIEYTLTCSDDILDYEYAILNETSFDYSGNPIETNTWLNCNFENNLIYIKPYISSYIKDNEATIKLSITSVNNETKECIIYVPSLKRLFGVDEVHEIFSNNKVGSVYNLKPKINVDNTEYIYYTNASNEVYYDNNYFFSIGDKKKIIKRIDDYTFEIQKVGPLDLWADHSGWTCIIYDGSVFEFKSTEKIVVNKNEVFNIELNSDYQHWNDSYPNIRNIYTNWGVKDSNILHAIDTANNFWYGEDGEIFCSRFENECDFFAKNVGKTKIIVRNEYENIIIEKEVEVINPIKKINFDKISLELNKGETYSLVATVTPSDATYKDLKWSSSNNKVATVDENGKITAINNGLVVITAEGHGDIEERCVVFVKDDKPNNIIITTLPVTSNIKFAKNTVFNSIATVENFPILGYEGYGVKLYSSSGEEKANDSILGSKDIISVFDTDEMLTTYNVVVKGDVSGDGAVKIYDSFQILKGVLINEELDEVETEIRDFNDDGKVVIYDAFQYLKESILE